MRRVLALEDHGLAAVTGLANFRVQSDTPEERHSELLRHGLGATTGEDIHLVLAMRTHEITHILYYARDVDLHLAEHLNRFSRVLQRHVGRSRDHYGARQ